MSVSGDTPAAGDIAARKSDHLDIVLHPSLAARRAVEDVARTAAMLYADLQEGGAWWGDDA